MPPPPRRRDEIAHVSHEMAAPLALIRAGVDTLLSGALKDSRYARRLVRLIDRQTTRLQEFAGSLLALATIDGSRASAAEDVDMAAAVRLSVRDQRAASRARRIRITTDLAPGLRVAAGRFQLGQVLQNLLHNAVKYSHPNGRVDIVSRRSRGRVRVSVADHGIGIRRSELKNLFKRFHRTAGARRHAHGNGLGLFIVKRIVQARGGRVWARGAPGKGATFSFTLPRSPSSL